MKKLLPTLAVIASLLWPVSAASASARSELLVFTRSSAATGFDIWTIRGDGTGSSRLTRGERSEVGPVFSPDGNQIAFIRQHRPPERSTLWVMASDGSGKERLASNASSSEHIDWSPSGDEITYAGSLDGATADDLFIVDADTGSMMQLTETPTVREADPEWSPDGKQIVHTGTPIQGGEPDVWVTDLAGASTRLTESDRTDDRPTWSTDSSLIAFRSARDDSCGSCEDDTTSNPFVMKADGSDELRLASVFGSRTEEIRWAPDGQRLFFPVFYGGDSPASRDTDAEVFSVGVDGAGLMNLTANRDRAEVDPLLSQDGRRLYMLRLANDTTRLIRLRLSTGGLTDLTRFPSAQLSDVTAGN